MTLGGTRHRRCPAPRPRWLPDTVRPQGPQIRRAHEACGGRRQVRGFTLVEVLVTLVVVGLLSTLLWQAMGQVAQLETRLADSQALADRDQLRRAWLAQALAGVGTGPAGNADPLRGGTRELLTFTTMAPWPRPAGLERMQLRLQAMPGNGDSAWQLLARRVAIGAAGGLVRPRGGDDDPVLLLWQGRGEARFEYLDAAGAWHGQWPPAAGLGTAGTGPNALGTSTVPPAPPLPAAIRLLGAPGGPLVVPVVAQPNPLISRRDAWEQDDVGR